MKNPLRIFFEAVRGGEDIDEAKKKLKGNLCVNTGQGSGGGFTSCSVGGKAGSSSSMATKAKKSVATKQKAAEDAKHTISALARALVHKFTQKDRRAEKAALKKGRHHNIYRLAHQFGAIQDAEKGLDGKSGSVSDLKKFRKKLLDNFSDRTVDTFIKKVIDPRIAKLEAAEK